MVSESEAVVEIETVYPDEVRGPGPVARTKTAKHSVLVRDIDTMGWADGLSVEVDGPFEVTRTEELGGATLFVVEPYQPPAEPGAAPEND